MPFVDVATARSPDPPLSGTSAMAADLQAKPPAGQSVTHPAANSNPSAAPCPLISSVSIPEQSSHPVQKPLPPPPSVAEAVDQFVQTVVDDAVDHAWQHPASEPVGTNKVAPDPGHAAAELDCESDDEMPVTNYAISPGSLSPVAGPTEGSSDIEDTSSVLAAVDTFVDNVVADAAFSHAIDSEKRNVQNLIDKLVRQVQTPSELGSHATGNTSAGQSVLRTELPQGDLRTWTHIPPSSSASGVGDRVTDVFWTQNNDNVTLTVVFLANPPASARDLGVSFSAASFSVSVCGTQVLHEKLTATIDADSCLWSLDRSDPASPSLTLELEKASACWWPRLFESHDPPAYRIYDASSRPPAMSALPAPPPASETIVANADTPPPPDHPPPLVKDGDAEVSEVDATIPNDAAQTTGWGGKSANARGPGMASARTDIKSMINAHRAVLEEGGPGAGEAALQLATFYQHGIGLPKDNARAANLYRLALESGVLDSSAAFQLGLIYNQGCEGLEASSEEAVRWWTVSAKLGNAVAMYNLGVMYLNGSGCLMDPHRAVYFFKQASLLNPRLSAPEFSDAQFAEKVAQAAKMKRQKERMELSEEEKEKRRAEAMESVRYSLYGTAAIVTVGVMAVLVRNWWRNRL